MKHNYFYFEQVFADSTCKSLVDAINKHSDENFVERIATHTPKNSDVKMTFWRNCSDLLKGFEDFLHDVNMKSFGYDIYRMLPSDIINLNSYKGDDKGEYGWHSDGVLGELYDFKLTAVINVSSEPYEGGKLELFLNEPFSFECLDKPGSAIIFPSHIQHRVTPVTKGERKTVSMWIKGPLFR
jgi:PKHD-type hydroxylase